MTLFNVFLKKLEKHYLLTHHDASFTTQIFRENRYLFIINDAYFLLHLHTVPTIQNREMFSKKLKQEEIIRNICHERKTTLS